MPTDRPKPKHKIKTDVQVRAKPAVRQANATPKLQLKGRKAAAVIGEIVRTRAEAEAAIADAQKSNDRLREAIDILPQGIVFLDPEGRYILCNKKYSEIYTKSADLFQPGAYLKDTLRIGVERGDYPESEGREDEWIAERLEKLIKNADMALSRAKPSAVIVTPRPFPRLMMERTIACPP